MITPVEIHSKTMAKRLKPIPVQCINCNRVEIYSRFILSFSAPCGIVVVLMSLWDPLPRPTSLRLLAMMNFFAVAFVDSNEHKLRDYSSLEFFEKWPSSSWSSSAKSSACCDLGQNGVNKCAILRNKQLNCDHTPRLSSRNWDLRWCDRATIGA